MLRAWIESDGVFPIAGVGSQMAEETQDGLYGVLVSGGAVKGRSLVTPSEQYTSSATAHAALDSVASVVHGYVYRETGVAGAVVKAKANTTASAAAIVGVGTPSLGLAPLVGTRLACFSDLPTVGSVAYLSTSVAGKLQVAVPSAPYPSVALAIVRQVVSGSAPYTARVEWGVRSQVTGADLRTSLLAETAAMLGGSPSDYGVVFDDFDDFHDPADDTKWKPKIGKMMYGLTDDHRSTPSYMYIANNVLQGKFPPEKFGALCARPWRMTASLYTAAASGITSGLMILDQGNGWASVGIQSPPTGCSDNSLIGGADAGINIIATATSYYATRTVIGPQDELLHTWDMRSLGDNTVQWRVDGSAWSAPVAVTEFSDAGSGVSWAIGCLGAAAFIDYFGFFYKVR